MKFENIVQCINKTNGINTCEYILYHHTGGGDYAGNLKVLSGQTYRKVSCHYLIGIDGKVAKIGQDKEIQRHAGESKRGDKNFMNKYAIGIEIINVGQGFTEIQKTKVRELTEYLMQLHQIKPQNILRHKDVSPGRKIDPYDTLRNNEYKTFADYQNSYVPESVNNALKGNSELRHKTENNDLKNKLEETNNFIREIYNIQK